MYCKLMKKEILIFVLILLTISLKISHKSERYFVDHIDSSEPQQQKNHFQNKKIFKTNPQVGSFQNKINENPFNKQGKKPIIHFQEHDSSLQTKARKGLNENHFNQLPSLNPLALTRTLGVSKMQNSSNKTCFLIEPFPGPSGCIDCYNPYPLFNISSKSCTKCPEGEIFLSDLHICSKIVVKKQKLETNLQNGLTKKKEKKTNPKVFSLVIGGTISEEKDDIYCPQENPFFNGKNCINCDSFFNISSLTCFSCQEGEKYDMEISLCLQLVSNYQVNKWFANYPYKTLTETKKKINKKQKIACPPQKPFLINNNCDICQEGEYFNADNGICRFCSSDTIFVQKIKKCLLIEETFQTNIKTNHLLYSGISKSEVISNYKNNKEKGKKDCPIFAPYYNGNKCIKCPKQYPYFNLEYKDCTTCEQGLNYRKEKHQCIDESGEKLDPSVWNMLVTALSHEKLLK